MSDVIPFRPRKSPKEQESLVWVCGCGCATFMLNEDGSAVCAACETPANPDAEAKEFGAWARNPKREVDPDDEDVFTDIRGTSDTADFGRRHLQQRVMSDTAVAVAVFHGTGDISTWFDSAMSENWRWLRRRCKQWVKLVKDQR